MIGLQQYRKLRPRGKDRVQSPSSLSWEPHVLKQGILSTAGITFIKPARSLASLARREKPKRANENTSLQQYSAAGRRIAPQPSSRPVPLLNMLFAGVKNKCMAVTVLLRRPGSALTSWAAPNWNR